ncbi:uncharacterized protein si:dkey-96l17.6 [Pungitius pungitius]|uniref:uncharacterized protein si:dkey-96l17.6 n=1 Tax=Pungitius pungitius TaxID=134920 RepID=UPI002E15DEE7
MIEENVALVKARYKADGQQMDKEDMNQTEVILGRTIAVEKIDDYSATVATPRGPRQFQFDMMFHAEASQGLHVCIFAFGQTCSGKTYTMEGNREKNNPGIMPTSFNAIFDIIQENFLFSLHPYPLPRVLAYMLQLHSDRLRDLFVSPAGEAQAQPRSHSPARRVEIKRNRKGAVFAQGAETKEASSAQELCALFQQARANRHIASTKSDAWEQREAEPRGPGRP